MAEEQPRRTAGGGIKLPVQHRRAQPEEQTPARRTAQPIRLGTQQVDPSSDGRRATSGLDLAPQERREQPDNFFDGGRRTTGGLNLAPQVRREQTGPSDKGRTTGRLRRSQPDDSNDEDRKTAGVALRLTPQARREKQTEVADSGGRRTIGPALRLAAQPRRQQSVDSSDKGRRTAGGIQLTPQERRPQNGDATPGRKTADAIRLEPQSRVPREDDQNGRREQGQLSLTPQERIPKEQDQDSGRQQGLTDSKPGDKERPRPNGNATTPANTNRPTPPVSDNPSAPAKQPAGNEPPAQSLPSSGLVSIGADARPSQGAPSAGIVGVDAAIKPVQGLPANGQPNQGLSTGGLVVIGSDGQTGQGLPQSSLVGLTPGNVQGSLQGGLVGIGSDGQAPSQAGLVGLETHKGRGVVGIGSDDQPGQELSQEGLAGIGSDNQPSQGLDQGSLAGFGQANDQGLNTGGLVDPNELNDQGLDVGSLVGMGPTDQTSQGVPMSGNQAPSTSLPSDISSNMLPDVQDCMNALLVKIRLELGNSITQDLHENHISGMINWVTSLRMSLLPPRGTRLDRIIDRALQVTLRMHAFERVIRPYALQSDPAVKIIYAHIKLLLSVAPNSTLLLEQAFDFMHKGLLHIRPILDFEPSYLAKSSITTKHNLCRVFNAGFTLVVNSTIHSYKIITQTKAGASSLNLYDNFIGDIEEVNDSCTSVLQSFWHDDVMEDGRNITTSIQTLSTWLAPQDRVSRLLAGDISSPVHSLEESTCNWFEGTFQQFIRGNAKSLSITGLAGRGKSVLAAELVDRLQRSYADKVFALVSVAIGRFPTQDDSIGILRSILHQIVNTQCPGGPGLYTVLLETYTAASQTVDAASYESTLWNALELILPAAGIERRPVVITLDGLDNIVGGHQVGVRFCQRLRSIISRCTYAKLILLSRNTMLLADVQPADATLGNGIGEFATTSGTLDLSTVDDASEKSTDDVNAAVDVKYAIGAEATWQDIKAVVSFIMSETKYITALAYDEQQTHFAEIVNAAKGSFTWASMCCEILKSKQSTDAFKTLTDSTTSDLIIQLIETIHLSDHARLLLMYINVAARPLTIEELTILTAVGAEMSISTSDVTAILKLIKPLLGYDYHTIRISNSQIQSCLRRRTNITISLLSYVQPKLPTEMLPTLDPTSALSLAGSLFERHALMEYAIRYWVFHLQQNEYNEKSYGELKDVFPSSPVMPLLEKVCWQQQQNPSIRIWLDLACDTRTAIFTDQHYSVMQSHISNAQVLATTGHVAEASRSWHISVQIGRELLGSSHPITVECANGFMSVTVRINMHEHPEVRKQREDVLKQLVDVYDEQYGSSSEICIRAKKQLMEVQRLSQQNGATKQAGTGESTATDQDTSLEVGTADLITTGGMPDSSRISITLERAEDLASNSKPAQSDRIYLKLWNGLSVICRTEQSAEWHEQKISVVNAYAESLKRQERHSEASAILLGLADEYYTRDLTSEKVISAKLIKSAQILQSEGHIPAAQHIFQQTSATHEQRQVSNSATITQQQRGLTSGTNSTHEQHELSNGTTTHELVEQNTTSEHISQSTLLATLQSRLNSSRQTFDESIVTMTQQISKQLFEECAFEKASSVLMQTLRRTWKTLYQGSVYDVALPAGSLTQNIDLAVQLAQSFKAQRDVNQAADVYARLVQAAIGHSQHDQSFLERAIVLSVNFYDTHGLRVNVIKTLQEALPVYKRLYGTSHSKTLALLHELAQRCRLVAKYALFSQQYLQEIIEILVMQPPRNPTLLIEAAILVASDAWDEEHYNYALEAYSIVWNGLVTDLKQYNQFNQLGFVQSLFERYEYCLHATKTDISVLHTAWKQYVNVCGSRFGEEAQITRLATLGFAQLCLSSPMYQGEASTALKQVVKHVGNTVGQADNNTVDKQINAAYRQSIVQSASLDAETLSQAQDLMSGIFNDALSAHGWTHETTVKALTDVTLLHLRQGKIDEAVKNISTLVNENIKEAVSLEGTMNCAITTAEILNSAGQAAVADELIRDLHWSIISGKNSTTEHRFDLDVPANSTNAASFLAGLQSHRQSGDHLTWSEAFTTIRLESQYRQSFTRVLQAKSTWEEAFTTATPLVRLAIKNEDNEQVQAVERQVVAFYKQHATSTSTFKSVDVSVPAYVSSVLHRLARASENADFTQIVLQSSIELVNQYIFQQRHAEAYDVTSIAWEYLQTRESFTASYVEQGLQLAAPLVAHDVVGDTQHSLAQISTSIIRKLLGISRDQNIKVGATSIEITATIVRTLGTAQDWALLEPYLASLWSSSEVHRTWPVPAQGRLGELLVCVRYYSGDRVGAIQFCESIVYNIRRVDGGSRAATTSVQKLLIKLLTNAGLYWAEQPEAATVWGAQTAFAKAISVNQDLARRYLGVDSALLSHERAEGLSLPMAKSEATVDLDEVAKYLYLLRSVCLRISGHVDAKKLEEESIDAVVLNTGFLGGKDIWALKFAKFSGDLPIEGKAGEPFQVPDTWDLMI